MRPLPLSWPVGLPFWLAYAWAMSAELAFLRRTPRAAIDVDARDRGSMRVILVAGASGITLAFLTAWFVPSAALTSPMPAYVVGIVLLVSGGLLRRHCFRMLGPSFTFDVRVAPAQAVVERGAYRFVRHPSYTAGLLMGGGIGVALGNWLSIAVAIGPALLAYAYRISVEERAMVATLGAAYADYRQRTWRLIPFVI